MSRHPVVNDFDVLDAANATEELVDIVFGCHRRQVEDAKTSRFFGIQTLLLRSWRPRAIRFVASTVTSAPRCDPFLDSEFPLLRVQFRRELDEETLLTDREAFLFRYRLDVLGREYFERGVAINVLLVESDERLLGESGLPKLREKLVSTHLGLELLGKTGRRHRSLVSLVSRLSSLVSCLSLVSYLTCLTCLASFP